MLQFIKMVCIILLWLVIDPFMYFQSHNNYCLFQVPSISLLAQMCTNMTSNKKKLLELIKQCLGLGVNGQSFE